MEQGKGRKSSVWGTLRTQCKPQKPSLILPGLGNFLSCCHILTLLIWSQTKGWDMTSGDCCDHRGQLFPKSSTRNGLRRGMRDSLCSCLTSQCRNFSWKGNQCRASAIPSQPCCCCFGAPSQKLHEFDPGMVRTWRKSSGRLLNTLDPSGVLGNLWLS